MSLSSHAQALSDSLARAGLVPGSAATLIPRDFRPSTELSILFDRKNVAMGNMFRVKEVKTVPSLQFDPEPEASIDTSYMSILVDLDAPTPGEPKFAFWRHWVLPGLQPLRDVDGVVGGTKPALTEYQAPGAKYDSRPHKYLFLLFREPHGLSLSKEDVGGEEFVQRRSFDAATFITRHGLKLVGVNWMLGAGDGWSDYKGGDVWLQKS